MVWYGMVNVDLYSAIISKVSNALDPLVLCEFSRVLAKLEMLRAVPRNKTNWDDCQTDARVCQTPLAL